MPSTLTADADLTTRARIRNAAIRRFARDGMSQTSLKSIAVDAGVSPQLVIHHFGSRDGLRVACDRYVAEAVRDAKRGALQAGPGLDVTALLRDFDRDPPLMRYLARSLSDGSDHVTTLVDQLVDDAVEYLAQGEQAGAIRPSDEPRHRAVVLVLWQLGGLVLHEHAERLLGVDLTGDVEGSMAWGLAAAEILARGVITEDVYDQWRAAVRRLTSSDDEPPAST